MTDREKLAALKARIDEAVYARKDESVSELTDKIKVVREAAETLSRLIAGLPKEIDDPVQVFNSSSWMREYYVRKDAHNALLQTVTDLILGDDK